MKQHFGSQPVISFAMLCLASSLPLRAAGASPAAASGPAAANPAVAMADTAPQRLAIPPRAVRLKGPRPPAPLKHLYFSTSGGFALRMSGDQEITAEIRNGAGRTLAFTSRSLEPGEWTLRPRNLAPGLYTVLLRTGPNLRALRMKIEDPDRGHGRPEWVLEKAPDSTRAPEPQPRGAVRPPAVPGLASAP